MTLAVAPLSDIDEWVRSDLLLIVLYVVVDRLGVPKPLGMLAALAVTVPASFLLLRRGFGG